MAAYGLDPEWLVVKPGAVVNYQENIIELKTIIF